MTSKKWYEYSENVAALLAIYPSCDCLEAIKLIGLNIDLAAFRLDLISLFDAKPEKLPRRWDEKTNAVVSNVSFFGIEQLSILGELSQRVVMPHIDEMTSGYAFSAKNEGLSISFAFEYFSFSNFDSLITINPTANPTAEP